MDGWFQEFWALTVVWHCFIRSYLSVNDTNALCYSSCKEASHCLKGTASIIWSTIWEHHVIQILLMNSSFHHCAQNNIGWWPGLQDTTHLLCTWFIIIPLKMKVLTVAKQHGHSVAAFQKGRFSSKILSFPSNCISTRSSSSLQYVFN